MNMCTKDAEKAEVVTICDHSCGHLDGLKFSPYLPNAFTEHGAIMAASILKSRRATDVSVFIVRAFIRLRQTVAGHRELAQKLARLERKLTTYDQQILSIIQAVKQLASPAPLPKKRRIGFSAGETE